MEYMCANLKEMILEKINPLKLYLKSALITQTLIQTFKTYFCQSHFLKKNIVIFGDFKILYCNQ